MSFSAQFRDALRWAWLIVSAVVLLVLLAPFVLPARTIDTLTPVCEWKAKYNRECPLCGMTHAFLAISEGRFEDASRRNRAGIPLYAALVLNDCVAVFYLAHRRSGRGTRSPLLPHTRL